MNDLREEFPGLPTEQAAEIMRLFNSYYRPQWMDHDSKRDTLIGFAACWMILHGMEPRQ